MQSLQLGRSYAIMMVGIPGSGKSFFASQFADTFGAPYVDSLAIESRSRDAASAAELITLMVNEIAKTHQSFVFEGNGDSRARRTEFARWARSKGYHPLFIWVQTDQRTALSRALKSGSLDKQGFLDVMRDFSPPHPDERALVISGKHTYSSQARVVLGYLGQANRSAQVQPVPQTAVPERSPQTRSISVR